MEHSRYRCRCFVLSVEFCYCRFDMHSAEMRSFTVVPVKVLDLFNGSIGLSLALLIGNGRKITTARGHMHIKLLLLFLV